ncbi:isoflavone-7-O-methyltransferase 9-like [Capsicum annuum]|uniref:isoflavone-7-O-methyltransferase 9-like n=1 Tax=Capsicum annuum TaxID=4072 RepID=UPI001FB1791A|nr:isoflavone-7-O-methyltransferase 9-like [Capsicum annuum]
MYVYRKNILIVQTNFTWYAFFIFETKASESSNQEKGWVVCRVFKKKNYHKALESPQNSSTALSRGTIIQKPNNNGLVMHNWSDEDCVKTLQRCREASTYNDEGRKGKVLIIDMVLNRDEDEADMTKVKLLFNVLMMVLLVGGGGGGQRNEKEWERLFLESGFMS